jgi:SynChlorMet cassette radical SAM/SPASM protein ScmE
MAAYPVMPTPRIVEIAITGKCNLACKYCFYADEMVARGDLPTERWLTFFEELGDLGVMRVTLTGGEVFTRPDLFELIDGVIANRMRYGLLTNGTLITEKVLAEFAVGKRRRRLDNVQISIDGSTAEIHNRSRPNSFDRAVRGLRLLVEARFPVAVRVTINRHNVNDLENIARLLLEDIGVPSFGTNEADPCGAVNRAEIAEQGIMLTPAQRVRAQETLEMLDARYPGGLNSNAGPHTIARDLRKIDEAIAAGQTGFPGRGYLSACGGVFNKIAVLHDGTIVPCHQVSTLRLGTVGRDSLQQVWLHGAAMEAMRERRYIPLESLETCQGCKYQGFCTGGCPGAPVFLYGDMNAIDPLSCWRLLKGEHPDLSLNDLFAPHHISTNADKGAV